MTVYKPAKSRFWQYDFVYKGRRYHGSTGQQTRRAAEAVERKLRLDAAEGRLGEASQFTLDQAAGKYWLEHAKDRGDAVDTERRLDNLLKLIPKTMRLADITTGVVSEAMQKRRGQTFKRGPDRIMRDGTIKKAKEYTPSNATVNRDVIQTLRPILRRARTHWDAKGLPEIAWGDLALPVPRETVRVYSRAEREAWADEADPTTRLALRLLMRYGLRLGELFFPLHAFEPEGPRLAWMKGRKLDVPHTIPLLDEDAQEIAARVGRAQAAKLETIWYEEAPPKKEGDPPRLVEIPYYGLQARLRSSSRRAGIRQGRVIHGARHHAGTMAQRAGKNVKATQRLLGHLDPRSTNRYVHAMDEDVLAALEAVEAASAPPPRAKNRKGR
jgi:integrase